VTPFQGSKTIRKKILGALFSQGVALPSALRLRLEEGCYVPARWAAHMAYISEVPRFNRWPDRTTLTFVFRRRGHAAQVEDPPALLVDPWMAEAGLLIFFCCFQSPIGATETSGNRPDGAPTAKKWNHGASLPTGSRRVATRRRPCGAERHGRLSCTGNITNGKWYCVPNGRFAFVLVCASKALYNCAC